MSVEINPEMPGLDEASRRLDAMMAEESAAAQPKPTPTAGTSAESEQRAAQGKDQNAPTPEPLSTDTRATAEPNAAADKSTEAKPATEAPKTEPEKSRYAKSQERLQKTWESVNAEKTRLEAEKAKLETERQEMARSRAEFEALRKQTEQPAYQPADYAAASQQKKALADHQRAEAERLETAGKFDEAEKLRKMALKNDALSEDLAEHAENLRKNPPPGLTERAKQLEQQKQTWTLEAAKAFPELAKEGSQFQQTVAYHLQELGKSDPALLAHPSVIYHVSRLTAAEQKVQQLTADVARVPELEKELGELKAKVKEYEALTTPAGSTAIHKINGPSAGDEEADLERMAREMVTLR